MADEGLTPVPIETLYSWRNGITDAYYFGEPSRIAFLTSRLLRRSAWARPSCGLPLVA